MTIGMELARRHFRRWVDAATVEGQHTVVERHGKPVAVLVPVGWYVSKGGDPRGPLPEIDDEA